MKNLCVMLMIALTLFGCGDESTEKKITAFAIGTAEGTIDEISKTITVGLPDGTNAPNVATLTPTITVSSGATVSPPSGVAQNFTRPVVYTVTAEDGSNEAYTATVKNSDAKILSFSLASVQGTIEDNLINVVVPYGTNAKSLAPTITVSRNAKVSPLSGVVRDFTQPSGVFYTVTAERGNTSGYYVAVEVAAFPLAIANVSKTTVTRGEKIVLTGKFAASGNLVYFRIGGWDKSYRPDGAESVSSLSVVIPTDLEPGTYTISVAANDNKVPYPTPITIIG